MVSPRGVEVDDKDNVWFGDASGHQIGKFQGLEQLSYIIRPRKMHRLTPRILIRELATFIFSDYAGNKATRFDPKTESFVEYPLPTPESYPLFLDFDSKGRIWYAAGGPSAGKIGVADPGPPQSIRKR
jgi:streptogramin lyase